MIKALIEIRSPYKPNEVQTPTGQVAALCRSMLNAMDKCFSFCKILKGENRFHWTEECEEALQALKKHLRQVPLLLETQDEETSTAIPGGNYRGSQFSAHNKG